MSKNKDNWDVFEFFGKKIGEVFVHEMSVIPARLKYSSFMDLLPSYRFEMMMDPEDLPETGLTPYEEVWQEGTVKLRRYKTDDKITKKTPLLFIYALINKPYILDLRPNFSVIEFYKSQGFDVYLIDWGEPGPEHKFLEIEDYVENYMDNCVDMIKDLTGVDKINMFGWCMGGSFATMYTPLHPEKIKNLVTLTLPMDADHGGLLALWASEEVFHITKTIEHFGNMPAKLIRYSVIMMYPLREMRKNVKFYDNLENDAFLKAYALAEKWINDNIDVPGKVMLRFIKDIFQTNVLKNSQMKINNKLVDLKKINMPYLNIAADEDNLIPRESSTAIMDLVGSKDKHFWVIPGGHVGFAYDPRSKEYWGKITKWLDERDN